MTAFAGIDYDTFSVHIVIVQEDDGTPVWHERFLQGADAFERARCIRTVMPPRGWWDDAGVTAIAIEEQNSMNPVMRSAVQKLKMIQGAILSCLPRETLVEPMNSSHWRKTLEIPGNAPKEEVREWARTHGYAALASYAIPQDAADAYCLAMAVQKLTVPA